VPKSLGILLTTSPEHADLHTAIGLARAARERGCAVRLFVMCDGVYCVGMEQLRALARDGVQIAVCAHNASERTVVDSGDVANVTWGSQYELSKLAAECDRVIALN
jgi:sulfur relay (sulfurtransferase) complex TusBCD TusD component (DsrE family)